MKPFIEFDDTYTHTEKHIRGKRSILSLLNLFNEIRTMRIELFHFGFKYGSCNMFCLDFSNLFLPIIHNN